MGLYGRNGYNSGNYNMTSSAYAYEVEERENLIVEEQRRKAEKARLLAERQERRFHRFKLMAAVAVVFGGSLSVMHSHAAVTEQRIKNVNLIEKTISLENENNALFAEISDNVDLSYIENQAKERLGMTEPQEYQICYIDVPKQSYTVQYDVSENEEKENVFLASFASLLGK